MQRILILKPSSLGDVVQALPVLRLLKLYRPEAEIWWWVDESLAPLLEGDPDLTGVLRFPRRRWGKLRHWPEIWEFVQDLRRRRFDWVIDLQSLARSGLLAWFAGGRLTVGLDDAREGARGLYDLIIPRPSRMTHAVDWYLQALRGLGVPLDREFVWLPPRAEAAREVDALWARSGGPWIGLQPGARWDNKRWPIEHFRGLVSALGERQPRLRFVVLGASADRPLAEAIRSSAPERVVDLTGRTSLPGMVECLRRCDALVSNDTGPMHVASALGLPVIGLFGPTEPKRTGPYRQQHLVLQNRSLPCVPCMKPHCHHAPTLECLRSLEPRRVAEELCKRLGGSPAGLLGDPRR